MEDSARRFFGKYPGVVVDNAASGDAHDGSLVVRVPGLLEETEDEACSAALEVRARPCFPPGLFTLPAPGAPVWVEFAAGDLAWPLWSGAWHPPGAAPPRAGPAHSILKASGCEVTMDAKDGVRIEHAASDTRVLIGAAECVRVERGDSVINIEANGIRVEAGDVRVEIGEGRILLRGPSGSAIGLSKLLEWLGNHTHVGNLGAPTAPPIQPLGTPRDSLEIP